MKKLLKNICTAVCCTAVAAVMTVSAAADISFDMGKCFLEPTGAVVAQSSSEATINANINYGKDFITVTYILEGDMTDIGFWNNADGTVSCDVRLETEGADVFASMPAFTSGWAWVNPEKNVDLKYNEWVTISETMVHFYKGFGDKTPYSILIQIRGNDTEKTFENVQVSFRNLKINGVSVGDYVATTTEATTTTPATTTTAATTTTVATTTTTEATTTTPEPEDTTTEPEETEPVESEPEETDPAESEPEETDPTESEPEETEPTESEPEDTTTAATTTTAAPVDTTAPTESTIEPDSTTAAQTTPPFSSIDYSQYTAKTDAGDATTMVVVIAIIAGVIVLAAIIGFIIYKKMKFY